ncbi:hypothetical protein ES332_A11G006100v1 [Gossypium tomentosum]|uniref:Uncharacterized protein n=1 Tax=Gossypium tomentosum TaxID=34277 RepID=A0A5D2N3Q3_GOSTO|nr:hypothetical protein ES332_A11G006100v1 [Gossypium tomentosum]
MFKSMYAFVKKIPPIQSKSTWLYSRTKKEIEKNTKISLVSLCLLFCCAVFVFMQIRGRTWRHERCWGVQRSCVEAYGAAGWGLAAAQEVETLGFLFLKHFGPFGPMQF